MFFDVTIIGAGVVGLSIAKFCSEQGYSVVVLEQESRAGEGVSSRNSGVLHAGIYYPKNSLKSILCNQGNKMLYQYCTERGIPIKMTGKLVLGNSKEDRIKLNRYVENAAYYGGDPLEIINQKDMLM